MKVPGDKKKTWFLLFKLIAIVLPVAVLILFEVILRVAGYGADLRLFCTDQTGKYYYLNPQIGKRYFTQEINATNGNMDFFKKEKVPGTIRLFVLGSSTALGFPYMYNGAFPQMLKYQLQQYYPDSNVEMVNLSLTAINSYAILDIAKEIPEFQPDVVLIYAGQNEYHGSLGIASSGNFGSSPFWTKLFIQSKKLRFMQLIYNAIYSSRKITSSTDLHLTLMERLAAGQKIPFNSSAYKAGVIQFEQNLNAVLNTLSSHKIPVVIGTLVTNKRGIHPFESAISNPELAEKWNLYYEGGKLALEKKDTLTALRLFAQACKLDSTYAECQFKMGEISFAKKDYKLAKRFFTNAKELDQLRFRAPEIFNQIITKAAAAHPNVLLADVSSAFDSVSPRHIVGEELLLEHVHPNLNGYYLMAETYFKSLKTLSVFEKKNFKNVPAEIIRRNMPLSKFDTAYGYISTILLKENWPFNEALPEPAPIEKTYEGKVAGGLAVKQYSWETAMEKLFNYYWQQSDFESALRVAEGQCLESPFKVLYFERAAKLAQNLKNDEKALFYLKKIWRNFVKNNEIAKQLAVLNLNDDHPEQAIAYLDYMILNATANQKLVETKKIVEQIIQQKNKLLTSGVHQVGTLNAVAELYAKAENYVAASKYIGLSLHIEPDCLETKRIQKLVDQLDRE